MSLLKKTQSKVAGPVRFLRSTISQNIIFSFVFLLDLRRKVVAAAAVAVADLK